MKISNSTERIKRLMEYFNLNQTEFCNITHVQKSTLSNYISGQRVPRQDQIDHMSRPFNVNPAWLMGYDVAMFIETKEADFPDEEVLILKAYKDASPAIQEAVQKLLNVSIKSKPLPGQSNIFEIQLEELNENDKKRSKNDKK